MGSVRIIALCTGVVIGLAGLLFGFSSVAADITPPVISEVKMETSEGSYTSSGTSVSFTWTTNKKTNGKVEYGTSAGKYTDSVTEEESGLLQHQLGVSGLELETRYYFRISSTDLAGNISSSKELTYTTPPKEIKILKVEVTDVGSDTAAIRVDLNRAADIFVKYGTASGKYTLDTYDGARGSGIAPDWLFVAGTPGSKSGTLLIKQLQPKTKYYFVASARFQQGSAGDVVPESTVFPESSFTTTTPSEITSINPTDGSPGTDVTIKGKSFGKDIKLEKQKIIVAVGCPIKAKAEDISSDCEVDVSSWADSEIKIRITDRAKNGVVSIFRGYIVTGYGYVGYGTTAHSDELFPFVSQSGPAFIIVKKDQQPPPSKTNVKNTNQPESNTNTANANVNENVNENVNLSLTNTFATNAAANTVLPTQSATAKWPWALGGLAVILGGVFWILKTRNIIK